MFSSNTILLRKQLQNYPIEGRLVVLLHLLSNVNLLVYNQNLYKFKY